GRPDRPGARDPGRGGARTAVPPGLLAGLPGPVPGVRRAARGPGARRSLARADRPAVGRARAAEDHVRREERELAVAVPKRKMSRSNTRARRSQWKTTAT